MAIQIPDAGTGNGATGDNEFVLWTKVINNFSDQTNAASRLVGTGAEQIPLSKNIPSLLGTAAAKNVGTEAGNVMEVGAFGVGKALSTTTLADLSKAGTGLSSYIASGTLAGAAVIGGTPAAFIQTSGSTQPYQTWRMFGVNKDLYYQYSLGASGWSEHQTLYHTKNTTKDANGFLKGASPIVKVFADKVELNDDAVNQSVSYKKNGVGDYTITTVSGLSTDGWYIELPKDMNGNPKVAIGTLDDTDGVITLKTYKRIFSMETFTFEPDLDNPLDVPDGRWIDLRLNEIPVEMPDDIQTEQVDIDKE